MKSMNEIKKSLEVPPDALATIISEPKQFQFMLNVGFGNGLFSEAILKIKKDGVFITNSDFSKHEIGVVSFISKTYFVHYEVNEQVDSYLRSGKREIDVKNMKWERDEFGLLSITNDTFILRGAGSNAFEFRFRNMPITVCLNQ